tara:strand:- start:27383 stop:27865 length:483 start_codon:yes stop_codon:yes gene_type:complete
MQGKKEIIRSILLPLKQGSLLLPHSSMVEIIPERIIEPLESAAEWVLGLITWNNESIPLLELETAFGIQSSVKPKRPRLVVIPSLTNDHGYKYLAIRTTGVPTMIQLTGDELLENQGLAFNQKYVQFSGELQGRSVIVSDITKLEADLLLKVPHRLTEEA